MTDQASVLDALKKIGNGSASAAIGMTPAQLCVAKLRSFQARTGRKLNANQRHVLESCERMLAGKAPRIDE